jgi:hypothetical protein
MSAQGATLERQGTQLPMWPVVALVIVALVTAIGLNFVDDSRSATQTTSVAGRASASKGVDRSVEVGAVAPAISAAAIQASSAAVRERPAAPFHSTGRAHEVVLGGGQASAITYANGLENPGGYVTAPLSRATSGSGYGDCMHCQQRR